MNLKRKRDECDNNLINRQKKAQVAKSVGGISMFINNETQIRKENNGILYPDAVETIINPNFIKRGMSRWKFDCGKSCRLCKKNVHIRNFDCQQFRKLHWETFTYDMFLTNFKAFCLDDHETLLSILKDSKSLAVMGGAIQTCMQPISQDVMMMHNTMYGLKGSYLSRHGLPKSLINHIMTFVTYNTYEQEAELVNNHLKRHYIDYSTRYSDIDFFSSISDEPFIPLDRKGVEMVTSSMTTTLVGKQDEKRIPTNRTIQLVKNGSGQTLKSQLDQFDFDVCKVGFNGEKVFYSFGSESAIKNNYIVNTNEAPVVRLVKYRNKGVHIFPEYEHSYDYDIDLKMGIRFEGIDRTTCAFSHCLSTFSYRYIIPNSAPVNALCQVLGMEPFETHQISVCCIHKSQLTYAFMCANNETKNHDKLLYCGMLTDVNEQFDWRLINRFAHIKAVVDEVSYEPCYTLLK